MMNPDKMTIADKIACMKQMYEELQEHEWEARQSGDSDSIHYENGCLVSLEYALYILTDDPKYLIGERIAGEEEINHVNG